MLYLFHFCCSRNSWTRSSIYVELLRSLTGLGSLRFLGITISSQQGKWRGVLERSTNSKYIIFYAFSICQFCASSFTCFFCIKALIGMLWNCSIECWLLIHLRYLFVWHDYPLFLSHSLSLFACKVMVDFTIRIIISSYLSENFAYHTWVEPLASIHDATKGPLANFDMLDVSCLQVLQTFSLQKISVCPGGYFSF